MASIAGDAASAKAAKKTPTPIHALRLFPPIAIARFGSSPEPLENYMLDPPPFDPNFKKDEADYRTIIPAPTLEVDPVQGSIRRHYTPNRDDFSFRDAQRRIKPVCPFFEVWFQREAEGEFEPLRLEHLASHGLGADAVKWSVEAANLKAYRRTGDTRDKVTVQLPPCSDHDLHQLLGRCRNFRAGALISFGNFRYIKPTPGDIESQIRARFTPAAGLVFGPGSVHDVGRTDGSVYEGFTTETNGKRDPRHKGRWDRYYIGGKDPVEGEQGVPADPNRLQPPPPTAPVDIFQGEWIGLSAGLVGQTVTGETKLSHGYFDDTCDGVIELRLTVEKKELTAFARFASSVPDFAPDSLPVRSIADDIEQIVLGTDPSGLSAQELSQDVVDIVRRGLDTMQQMNTRAMNGDQEGWDYPVNERNMAWKHGNFGRLREPIYDQDGANYPGVLARHKRLTKRVAQQDGKFDDLDFVRKPDEVGKLGGTDRTNMPVMMRGSEALNLALTWRMYNKLARSSGVPPSFKLDPSAKAREKAAAKPVEPLGKLTIKSLRRHLRSGID